MNDTPEWLPQLITLEDQGGDWDVYLRCIYAVFRRQFIETNPLFDGCYVRCPREPLIENMESTFWHCISEGILEDQRNPDLRRMERILWIRAIIEHADDDSVEHWTNTRGTSTHHLLWVLESYLVVLKELIRKRDGFRYFILKTAYETTSEGRKDKLRKERDAAL